MGATTHYRDLAHFGRDYPGDITRLTRQLGTNIHRRAHLKMAVLTAAGTPRGTGEKPYAHMVLFWRNSIAGTISGLGGSTTAVKAIRLGRTSIIGNSHPGVADVDLGRRRRSNGAMGGSTKAARGITGPVEEQLLSAFPGIVDAEVARIENTP